METHMNGVLDLVDELMNMKSFSNIRDIGEESRHLETKCIKYLQSKMEEAPKLISSMLKFEHATFFSSNEHALNRLRKIFDIFKVAYRRRKESEDMLASMDILISKLASIMNEYANKGARKTDEFTFLLLEYVYCLNLCMKAKAELVRSKEPSDALLQERTQIIISGSILAILDLFNLPKLPILEEHKMGLKYSCFFVLSNLQLIKDVEVVEKIMLDENEIVPVEHRGFWSKLFANYYKYLVTSKVLYSMEVRVQARLFFARIGWYGKLTDNQKFFNEWFRFVLLLISDDCIQYMNQPLLIDKTNPYLTNEVRLVDLRDFLLSLLYFDKRQEGIWNPLNFARVNIKDASEQAFQNLMNPAFVHESNFLLFEIFTYLMVSDYKQKYIKLVNEDWISVMVNVMRSSYDKYHTLCFRMFLDIFDYHLQRKTLLLNSMYNYELACVLLRRMQSELSGYFSGERLYSRCHEVLLYIFSGPKEMFGTLIVGKSNWLKLIGEFLRVEKSGRIFKPLLCLIKNLLVDSIGIEDVVLTALVGHFKPSDETYITEDIQLIHFDILNDILHEGGNLYNALSKNRWTKTLGLMIESENYQNDLTAMKLIARPNVLSILLSVLNDQSSMESHSRYLEILLRMLNSNPSLSSIIKYPSGDWGKTLHDNIEFFPSLTVKVLTVLSRTHFMNSLHVRSSAWVDKLTATLSFDNQDSLHLNSLHLLNILVMNEPYLLEHLYISLNEWLLWKLFEPEESMEYYCELFLLAERMLSEYEIASLSFFSNPKVVARLETVLDIFYHHNALFATKKLRVKDIGGLSKSIQTLKIKLDKGILKMNRPFSGQRIPAYLEPISKAVSVVSKSASTTILSDFTTSTVSSSTEVYENVEPIETTSTSSPTESIEASSSYGFLATKTSSYVFTTSYYYQEITLPCPSTSTTVPIANLNQLHFSFDIPVKILVHPTESNLITIILISSFIGLSILFYVILCIIFKMSKEQRKDAFI